MEAGAEEVDKEVEVINRENVGNYIELALHLNPKQKKILTKTEVNMTG